MTARCPPPGDRAVSRDAGARSCLLPRWRVVLPVARSPSTQAENAHQRSPEVNRWRAAPGKSEGLTERSIAIRNPLHGDPERRPYSSETPTRPQQTRSTGSPTRPHRWDSLRGRGFGLRGVLRLGVEFLVGDGGATTAVTVTPGPVVRVKPTDEPLPRAGLGGEHHPVDQLGFEEIVPLAVEVAAGGGPVVYAASAC